MSGTRTIWNEGYPTDYRDLQRLADQAAGAPDEVWSGIMPGAFNVELWPNASGQADHMVTPLNDEGSSGFQGQLLVVPSAVAGKLRVHPALYHQNPLPSSGNLSAPNLIAKQLASIDSATIGNNASGNPRIDLIYATIQRTVDVVGARPFRDSTGVNTVSLNLASDPTVAITVLPGTPAGSPVAPSLPADSASAWNFPLALLAVANGYAGAAIAASAITQIWTRGGIRQDMLRPIIGGDAYTTFPASLLASRIGPKQAAFCPVTHNSNPQTSALLGFDQFDMRQRVIRVKAIRPLLDTTYKAPASVTKGGVDSAHAGLFDTGLIFTGTDGAVGTPCYTATLVNAGNGGAGNIVISIWADTGNGTLWIKFAGVPYNAADAWWIEVDFSGSFKSIR